MPSPAGPELQARTAEPVEARQPVGIDARQLARRATREPSPLTGRELRKWLLAEDLATETFGLLHPTQRCREIAGGLAAIERDSASNR